MHRMLRLTDETVWRNLGYLSACTRATTVFAILKVFFAAKLGLAFSVAG